MEELFSPLKGILLCKQQKLLLAKQNVKEGKQKLLLGKQNVKEGKQKLLLGKQKLLQGKQNLKEGKQNLKEGNQNLKEGKHFAKGLHQIKYQHIKKMKKQNHKGFLTPDHKRYHPKEKL